MSTENTILRKIQSFYALFHARNMEFVRDRGTFFWNILFPLFLVFGFAFAFSGGEEDAYTAGIIGRPEAGVQGEFLELEYINFLEYDSLDTALSRLRHHQLDIVVDYSTSSYYISEAAASGYMAERIFLGAVPEGAFAQRSVVGQPIRYVDWLVPGVIGMNIMFSSLFGVGFVIVRYRKNGVLKRIKATPVKPIEFVTAQALSRLTIVVLTTIFVYTGTNLFLNFMMLGSYWTLLLVTILSIICMISLGLIFAARIKSEELASGLMNLVLWPMVAFSGVFFSLEGTPEVLQTIAQVFPLTHFIEAARSIMLDGAGFVEVLPNIGVLVGLTGVFLVISSLTFAWE